MVWLVVGPTLKEHTVIMFEFQECYSIIIVIVVTSLSIIFLSFLILIKKKLKSY
jgi:hypothetical protein